MVFIFKSFGKHNEKKIKSHKKIKARRLVKKLGFSFLVILIIYCKFKLVSGKGASLRPLVTYSEYWVLCETLCLLCVTLWYSSF